MPRPRGRHRATSTGSYAEVGTPYAAAPVLSADKQKEEWSTEARALLEALRMFTPLHVAFRDLDNLSLFLAHSLLERCRSLEENHSVTGKQLTEGFLSMQTPESGYTPLHQAIVSQNLAAILLCLEHETSFNGKNKYWMERLVLCRVKDREGNTPLELLCQLQRGSLQKARQFLKQQCLTVEGRRRRARSYSTRSSSFDIPADPETEDEDLSRLMHQNGHLLFEEEDEDGAEQQQQTNNNTNDCAARESYGFEVITFGRPQHPALGVISRSGTASAPSVVSTTSTATAGDSDTHYYCRPQRVQEFAQEHRNPTQSSAVVVAASTHHTLVACQDGGVYVCGVNKNGRLGLGNAEVSQSPLPRPIPALRRHKVIALAAAENHSLCVTQEGTVWSWGSNQFGQLGENNNNNTSTSAAASHSTSKGINSGSPSVNYRSTPKPVDDLNSAGTRCIAVAAGERHSVALSTIGEVFVWGNNASGQLGVARRSGHQKVQRVEALWAANAHQMPGNRQAHSAKRKIAIAVAAADQSTLVLTAPQSHHGQQVNSVYGWGHGNHVPMRVHFENAAAKSSNFAEESSHGDTLMARGLINPIAIACARYHNAVVTADGHVYTWGTSSESLGHRSGSSQNNKLSHRALPQLVTGMLPENGGGIAVDVSASGQHTAVVCDNGAVFTWGVAYGKNVMGHEGVRWQPNPKRVPGVHRAVKVAVAKEHTVVLMGTTFPGTPKWNKNSPSSSSPRSASDTSNSSNKASVIMPSLEALAARAVIPHVDMFNVLPILIMAEHTQCNLLVDYCSHFVRMNLDGVLCVCKRKVLKQYLDDMLAQSIHISGQKYRDGALHPFVADVVLAGNQGRRPTFYRDYLSPSDDWLTACHNVAKSSVAFHLLALSDAAQKMEEEQARRQQLFSGRRRRASSACYVDSSEIAGGRNRSSSVANKNEVGETSRKGSLDIIIHKTASMDLTTKVSTEENSRWLGKEIRGIQKKLAQISKLRDAEARSLTADEVAKVDRKPVLEAELLVYQSALKEVEKRVQELLLEESNAKSDTAGTVVSDVNCEVDDKESKMAKTPLDENKAADRYTCKSCNCRCPDKTSFELHLSGRKHRNRLAQLSEEEKQQTAQQMMEKKQMDHIRSPSTTPPSGKSIKTTKKNAWGITSTPPPKFKLPPPPHPVGLDAIPVTTPKPAGTSVQAKVKSSPTSSIPSPWNVPKNASPASVSKAPFHLHSHNNLVHPAKIAVLDPHHAGNTVSLADFLAPEPAPSQKLTANRTSRKAAWKASPVPAAVSSPSAGKSLMEIQAEENDLKSRSVAVANSNSGDNGWFISERRERADSLHAIQEAAEQERMMIQEQFEIEAQIQREIALAKKQQRQQRKGNSRFGNKQKQKTDFSKRRHQKETKKAIASTPG